MKPATALPWAANKAAIYTLADNVAALAVTGTSEKNHADAQYIAHSANAYPRLVEKLRDMYEFLKPGKMPIHGHALIFAEDAPAVEVLGNLLRELGELGDNKKRSARGQSS